MADLNPKLIGALLAVMKPRPPTAFQPRHSEPKARRKQPKNRDKIKAARKQRRKSK